MAHKSFIGKRTPKSVRTVLESLHGDPVKEFREETQRLKDLRIEKATGVPAPKKKKKKQPEVTFSIPTPKKKQ